MFSLKLYKWPFILALAVATGLVFAFWPRAIAVDLEAVSAGPLSVTVDDDGVTRIREVYTVTAPVTGRILRVEKHAGDAVEGTKTVLVSILPAAPAFRDARTQRELEASLRAAQEARRAARSQIDSAQASLDYARAEFARATEMRKKEATSTAAVDRAQRQLRMAESALAAAQAILEQRDAELKGSEAALLAPSDANGSQERCCLDVVAPVNGDVLRVLQESETVVTAGTPLMEVGDAADLEIVADLLSRDALKVSPGDVVYIENWGGEGVLNGKVRLIEPAGVTKVSSLGIEEQRVNVIIDLTDPHKKWERLGHGFQIDVRIVIWHKDDAVQVPMGALFRRDDDWAVFRDENGRARVRVVKIGHLGNRYAEVLEGLVAGERVILHPSDLVKDGIRIRQRTE